MYLATWDTKSRQRPYPNDGVRPLRHPPTVKRASPTLVLAEDASSTFLLVLLPAPRHRTPSEASAPDPTAPRTNVPPRPPTCSRASPLKPTRSSCTLVSCSSASPSLLPRPWVSRPLVNRGGGGGEQPSSLLGVGSPVRQVRPLANASSPSRSRLDLQRAVSEFQIRPLLVRIAISQRLAA